MKNIIILSTILIIASGCSHNLKDTEKADTPQPESAQSALQNDAAQQKNISDSDLDKLKSELTKVDAELKTATENLEKAEAQLKLQPKSLDLRLSKKRNAVENEVKQYQFIKSNLVLKKGHLESKIKVLEQADIQPK